MKPNSIKPDSKANYTADRVKAANQEFYDAIAERYEEIDGRRSPPLEQWVRVALSDLRTRVTGGRLLDIGTGSGLVTRCARGLFDVRVGTDISAKILSVHSASFDVGVAADVDSIPFADGSFDVVTCFSVLHHLCTFEGLVSEIARTLKPGGLFYSDHDMDAAFNRRFRLPLAIYRRFRNASGKYRQANETITEELYDLTECQKEGIDSSHLIHLLEQAGFTVEARFHWFGLSPLTDSLFGTRSYERGWAPLVSTIGTKHDHK